MDLERDGGPKLKGSGDDIDVGTLLAFTGIFAAVVRARFTEPGIPWRWTPVFERTEEQNATPAAPDPIFVSTVFDLEPAARSAIPRVIVGVEGAQLNKVVNGNRAAVRTPDRTQVFYAHDTIPVQIRCHGREAGESATIADLVRKQIAVCANPIREAFNIHEISLPSMSAPQETREGDEAPSHVALVSFIVTNEVKWKTVPIAPLLQEIAAIVRSGGAEAARLAVRGFTQ